MKGFRLDVVCLTIILSVAGHLNAQCDPKVCTIPACRCFDDPNIPGNLLPMDTPQIILITSEKAINKATGPVFEKMFGTRVNPNGCLNAGTIFVQDTYTDYNEVKRLKSLGHEFGATSLDGAVVPPTPADWLKALSTIKSNLVAAGLKPGEVLGVRSPDLFIDGDIEFASMKATGYYYDASCSTTAYATVPNLKWPYTYDYRPWPNCNIGVVPTASYPGRAQIMLPALQYNGTFCATPSGCWQADTKEKVFGMFYERFLDHYNSNRAPFMISMDPLWLTKEFAMAGTTQFLDYIRLAYADTWIITATQALLWMADPTPSVNITNFVPWQCTL